MSSYGTLFSPHGHGEGVYSYEGELRHGKPNRHGTFRNASGDVIYEGEFLDEKELRRGVCNYANGDVYDGQWQNGEKHGRGMLRLANGDIYEGGWRYGKMHGRGKMARGTNDIPYAGNWKEGSVLHGNFDDGRPAGYVQIHRGSSVSHRFAFRDEDDHGKTKLILVEHIAVVGVFVGSFFSH